MTRILIAALAALTSTAAVSNPPEIRFQENRAFISYRDLDLSSQQDRDVLVGRIKSAADVVCNPEQFNSYSQPDKTCVRLALKSGIRQMDEALTASNGR